MEVSTVYGYTSGAQQSNAMQGRPDGRPFFCGALFTAFIRTGSPRVLFDKDRQTRSGRRFPYLPTPASAHHPSSR